jgi:hypothetical protein
MESRLPRTRSAWILEDREQFTEWTGILEYEAGLSPAENHPWTMK